MTGIVSMTGMTGIDNLTGMTGNYLTGTIGVVLLTGMTVRALLKDCNYSCGQNDEIKYRYRNELSKFPIRSNSKWRDKDNYRGFSCSSTRSKSPGVRQRSKSARSYIFSNNNKRDTHFRSRDLSLQS